jgi:hypothetical protein
MVLGINTFHGDPATCDLVDELGVKWVRIQTHWRAIEPVRGEYNWESEWWGGAGRLDTIIGNLHERGYKITFCVCEPPEWALMPRSRLPLPGEAARFCTELATRYNGKIQCYEVLAEEPVWSHEVYDHQAIKYVSILKDCYQAIKAVNPNNLVATCAMWGRYYTDTTYLKYLPDLYGAGAKRYFDIVNIHHYLGNATLEAPGNGLRSDLECLKRVMASNGDSKKPIWVTEFGYAVPNKNSDGIPVQNDGLCTEEQQAEYLTTTLDICRASGVVKNAFWYQLRNDDGMALVYTKFAPGDDRKRPAFYAYKDWVKKWRS